MEASKGLMLQQGNSADGGGAVDQAPASAPSSSRKSKRSPQKVRKRLTSPDPAGPVNSENYSYGDPRVEPLSQLSDIVTMDEPRTDRPRSVRLVSRRTRLAAGLRWI